MDSDSEDQFDLTGKVIGSFKKPVFAGNYSIVYCGNLALNGAKVAVKVINEVGSEEVMRRKLLRERMVWASLKHKNILPFYGHANDKKFRPYGAFISPWCSNGHAGVFLEQKGKSLDTTQRIELWKGVLTGVSFLHGRNPVIVHGDLKPANIIIDDDGSPRICDFGLASIFQDGGTGVNTTSEHTGTERYLAPELVNEELAKPTKASDVYAVGCLGLEFIYGIQPFAHITGKFSVMRCIQKGQPPATRDSTVDSYDPVWELLESCWDKSAGRRPHVDTILQSIYKTGQHPDSNSAQDSSSDICIHRKEIYGQGHSHSDVPNASTSNSLRTRTSHEGPLPQLVSSAVFESLNEVPAWGDAPLVNRKTDSRTINLCISYQNSGASDAFIGTTLPNGSIEPQSTSLDTIVSTPPSPSSTVATAGVDASRTSRRNAEKERNGTEDKRVTPPPLASVQERHPPPPVVTVNMTSSALTKDDNLPPPPPTYFLPRLSLSSSLPDSQRPPSPRGMVRRPRHLEILSQSADRMGRRVDREHERGWVARPQTSMGMSNRAIAADFERPGTGAGYHESSSRDGGRYSMLIRSLTPTGERPFDPPWTPTSQQSSGFGGRIAVSSLPPFKARALCDYRASKEDAGKLSFVKGQILDVVDNSGEWWTAKKTDGTSGRKVLPNPWRLGKLIVSVPPSYLLQMFGGHILSPCALGTRDINGATLRRSKMTRGGYRGQIEGSTYLCLLGNADPVFRVI